MLARWFNYQEKNELDKAQLNLLQKLPNYNKK
jgi:hypothetical protein